MAYIDFPEGLEGQKERKAFFLSEDGLKLIANWRRHGIALTKIAEDFVGISRTAWWGWYRESEELRKACTVSLDIVNATVEESLLKAATGYTYYDEVWELVEGELMLVRKTSHYIPPNIKATLAWLHNRMPNRWRAEQEPLESTEYVDTVKKILIGMKEVAENREAIIEVEAKEVADGE